MSFYLDPSMEPKVAIEWMSKGVLKTEAQTKTLEKLDDIEQKEQGFFLKQP